jgi:teichuronic acid biosynthesis glycosyltransferase TuaC
MRTLTFATLYPNSLQPRHGIFIEQRLRHLVATGEIESWVMAPVPWFPFDHRAFGRYAAYARVPMCEERYGIRIFHPRYPVLPRISMSLVPWLMAAAVKPVIEELLAAGYDFDLIDSHYLYPDGVAATILGRHFHRPVTISALGSDVSLLPRYLLPRRMILWAVGHAAGVTTVCQALKDALVELGASAEKIHPVRYGVDLDLFCPVDREAARRELGLGGNVLLSVGHLDRNKGHHLAIEALPALPEVTLLIAGTGGYERELRALAGALGVADRVRFLGHVDQERLKEFYGAADALVLASGREGLANVLLEAMACGTPVIATPVWGTPEAIDAPEAGVLMRERSAAALVEAARRLFAAYPDRAATRRHAARFQWELVNREHLDALDRALAAEPGLDPDPRFRPGPAPSAWRPRGSGRR